MLNDAKKSYNYMASPNYLQFENTYQKNKKICHSKDVTNFRDSNSHGIGGLGAANMMMPTSHAHQSIQPYHHQTSYMHAYDEDIGEENDDLRGHASTSSTRHDENAVNGKCINTMATLSSDDEGGFRRDAYNIRNHFNHDNNGNAHYSSKEVVPLLLVNNSNRMGPITKVYR